MSTNPSEKKELEGFCKGGLDDYSRTLSQNLENASTQRELLLRLSRFLRRLEDECGKEAASLFLSILARGEVIHRLLPLQAIDPRVLRRMVESTPELAPLEPYLHTLLRLLRAHSTPPSPDHVILPRRGIPLREVLQAKKNASARRPARQSLPDCGSPRYTAWVVERMAQYMAPLARGRPGPTTPREYLQRLTWLVAEVEEHCRDPSKARRVLWEAFSTRRAASLLRGLEGKSHQVARLVEKREFTRLKPYLELLLPTIEKRGRGRDIGAERRPRATMGGRVVRWAALVAILLLLLAGAVFLPKAGMSLPGLQGLLGGEAGDHGVGEEARVSPEAAEAVARLVLGEREKMARPPLETTIGDGTPAARMARDMVDRGYEGYCDPQGRPLELLYTRSGGVYAPIIFALSHRSTLAGIPVPLDERGVVEKARELVRDLLLDPRFREALGDPTVNAVDVGVAWREEGMALVVLFERRGLEWIKPPTLEEGLLTAELRLNKGLSPGELLVETPVRAPSYPCPSPLEWGEAGRLEATWEALGEGALRVKVNLSSFGKEQGSVFRIVFTARTSDERGETVRLAEYVVGEN